MKVDCFHGWLGLGSRSSSNRVAVLPFLSMERSRVKSFASWGSIVNYIIEPPLAIYYRTIPILSSYMILVEIEVEMSRACFIIIPILRVAEG